MAVLPVTTDKTEIGSLRLYVHGWRNVRGKLYAFIASLRVPHSSFLATSTLKKKNSL
jgi:hypothetical protein